MISALAARARRRALTRSAGGPPCAGRQHDATDLFLPNSADWSELPTDMQQYWAWMRAQGHLAWWGQFNWTLQTYLRLRAVGFCCGLAREIPAEGIVVAHRDFLPTDLRPSRRQLMVCLLADRNRGGSRGHHPYAQIHVVQNPHDDFLTHASPGWRAYYMPQWPQPGLLPRDPDRGDRFEVAAFFGYEHNLASELRNPQVRVLGLLAQAAIQALQLLARRRPRRPRRGVRIPGEPAERARLPGSAVARGDLCGDQAPSRRPGPAAADDTQRIHPRAGRSPGAPGRTVAAPVHRGHRAGVRRVGGCVAVGPSHVSPSPRMGLPPPQRRDRARTRSDASAGDSRLLVLRGRARDLGLNQPVRLKRVDEAGEVLLEHLPLDVVLLEQRLDDPIEIVM
jgi:hypothetical protein